MTTFTNTTVNMTGLAEIANFLRNNHKDGDRITNDQSCLNAWAAEAEEMVGLGNSAIIEIRAFDHIEGRTASFTISDEGLDVEVIKEGDE